MHGKYSNSETPSPAVEFPGILKASRIAKDWTVRAGAKKLGISTSTLQRYENGEGQPNLGRLKGMADVLGVTVDFLVGNRINEELDRS